MGLGWGNQSDADDTVPCSQGLYLKFIRYNTGRGREGISIENSKKNKIEKKKKLGNFIQTRLEQRK